MDTARTIWSLTLTAILASAAVVPAQAQHLIAWPLGRPNPIRLPGPVPGPRPIPRPPVIMPTPTPPILTPNPTPPVVGDSPIARPLELTGYTVEGSVEDLVANLTFHITFQNPTAQRLEGELVMPIPADTALSGFEMTMGGKMVKGELLESDKARTIYENIVRSMRDPGLLELIGERMIRARVFPIEPHGQITIRMDVTQVLRKSGELTSLRVPLRSAKMSRSTKGAASVTLALNAASPLRALYSPLPGVKIAKLGDNRARVSWKQGASEPEDLDLFWSAQRDPLAAGILAYREGTEDGFFLLNLSPKAKAETAQAAPKDLVFVVDRSGSMEEGGKMDQARSALSYVVGRLDAGDRFGIVDFATGVAEFEDKLVTATPENKKKALAYIAAIEAAGGTNIEGGLKRGLELLAKAPGRVPMLFFMTDGLPTVGSTSVEDILRSAGDKNAELRARLFTFGVGTDVNTLLLDKLAAANRGAGDYVAPEENIEAKVSSLYLKVAKPAMTDVKLSWEGVDVAQVYPRPVDDLFHGSELTIMGRYKKGGKGVLKVSGMAGGKPVSFDFPVELPAAASKHAFVPRLWAGKKIGHELDAIRLSGQPASQEAVDDIVKLAKKYGIVTPYTSFLVVEEGMNMAAARQDAARSMEAMRFGALNSGAAGGGAGSFMAQRQSRALSAMRGAISASAPMAMVKGSPAAFDMAEAPPSMFAAAEADARAELKAAGKKEVATKQCGGKTFYRRGDAWVDGDYELAGSPDTVKIGYLSAQYFELVGRKPALGRWLSVGEKVTVLDGGTAYSIE